MNQYVLILTFLLSNSAIAGKGACMHYLALLKSGVLPVESPVVVRRSDLDPYKHVGSSRYIDLLDSAVWNWYDSQASKEKIEDDSRVTSLQIDFRRPIIGVGPVTVGIASSSEPQLLSFEIRSNDKSTVFSSGRIAISNQAKMPDASDGLADDTITPIIYEKKIDVGYDDLNPSNEINLSKHLAYVITSRWHALKELFGKSNEDFIKRGIGFYMSQAEMHFVKPVVGAQTLHIRSWVSKIEPNGSEIIVPFEILSDQEVLSHGTLHFVIMDLTEKPKRTALPEWVKEYFWRTK